MGNRAVVKFKYEDENHGIYLHWNGGPASILAFLETLQNRGWTRMDYASARFAGVVCEYFDANGNGDGYSLGIVDTPGDWSDGCENGLYEIDQSENGELIVRQNGELISYEGFDVRERVKFDAIVDELNKLRIARESVAKKPISVF